MREIERIYPVQYYHLMGNNLEKNFIENIFASWYLIYAEYFLLKTLYSHMESMAFQSVLISDVKVIWTCILYMYQFSYLGTVLGFALHFSSSVVKHNIKHDLCQTNFTYAAQIDHRILLEPQKRLLKWWYNWFLLRGITRYCYTLSSLSNQSINQTINRSINQSIPSA